MLVSHPKVREAAVIGLPDKNFGECVCAFVVAEDPSLTVDELRNYARERLAGFKAPRKIQFRDELPKSNVGKILRRELRRDPEQQDNAPTPEA